MTEIDKTYNSVVLGALLHDIGKFLHRGEGKYKGEHEEASYRFITEHRDKLTNDPLYDIDLISFLTKFHGSTKNEVLTDQYFVDKADVDKADDEKEKLWRLVSIVIDADCYSCVERDLKQPRRKGIAPKKAPLDSIFGNINLEEMDAQAYIWRYSAHRLDPLSSFPFSLKAFDEYEYEKFIEEFERDLPDFSKLDTFDKVLNLWLSFLEHYVWAIPSDTRYEFSDVSLYDHLRTSAAIAACLYKRHIEDINAGEKLKRKYEFVLVGGDFSGIQNYIFDITNRGSGGASKRLRARSFFITLFSEVAIHKVLDSLRLPFVCNVFSTGGKFLLIAPNLEGIKERLQDVKNEIKKEIHEGYFTQFSFLIAWKDIKVYRDEIKVFNFFKIADEMFLKLETEKLRKAKDVLFGNDSKTWNPNAFKASELYESYKGNTDCKICGKGPAIYSDPKTGRVESCYICYRDRSIIGQKLPKANYVAFGKGIFDPNKMGDRIVIFKPTEAGAGEKVEGYYIELLKELPKSNDHYLIYRIGGENEQSKGEGPYLEKHYANHVPVDSEGDILDFKSIAEKSIWQREENYIRKSYGSDLLGILKADIDNLGLIFSKGFTKPRRDEEKLDEEDRKTVSRFLTMSRMIDLFFSGWMKDIMSNKRKEEIIDELILLDNIDKEQFGKYLKGDYIDFKNIYTVYSCGDDLVLVGPWETMIVFSIYLNQQFKKYTCQNNHITLSAGLTFVKEKHPIASAIKQADDLLEKSKKEGKDRITLFGTTVEWGKLPELVDFFLFLNARLNSENPRIKSAFLYNLFRYHQMAKRFIDENKIEGLKYVSALSYDMGRKIVEWDKEGRIKKGYEEYAELQRLISEKPDKHSLIYNLKIPLFWTLYRNRVIKI